MLYLSLTPGVGPGVEQQMFAVKKNSPFYE